MTDRPEHIAICPGSFDPITVGHEDIIRRALRFSDRVIVAVAHRSTQAKKGMFSVEERVTMISEVFADEPRVMATEFEGLLVEYARESGARMVIRGLRAVSDFEYEFQMALMNRALYPDLETVFLAPDADHSFLSSSLVREIGSLGGDISRFVSHPVLARIQARFGGAPD
ncbi:MAG TPA: pantetheine-phosphate adenylyltransferase [Longimicrobiaceae bacterium]|nr:pantetheine-phosphate adenylyltransferase [Longimicrobiaceae bacterium]